MSAELDEVAVERLHELIAGGAAVLGPHAFADEDDCEPDPTQPLPAVLEEWVLVMSWTDLATGEPHITRTWSRNLPLHHRTGLLHDALFW